jgi:outer membrane protein insertion porin family
LLNYHLKIFEDFKKMLRSKSLLYYVVLFIIFIPLLVDAQQAPIVTSIEIKGVKRIEEGAIIKRLNQKVGKPLSRIDISKDIKTIYKMGYFEDVRVEAEPYEGGIKLIYIVKEKPTIVRINFVGNRKFDDEKLKEHLTLSPGSISDITLIQSNVSALKSFYESKGYWLAQIIPIVKRISESETTVTFLIKEGPKIKIKKIIIEGNKTLSDKKIKKVMKTKKWWILSFITGSGYYESSEMKDDIERIKDLYYNNGYLNVVVSEPEITLTKDKKGMIIKIRVSEGPRYIVSEVALTGYTPSEKEEVLKLIEIKEGKYFSKKKLQKTIQSISEFYSQRGYAVVSVEPQIIPDEKTKEVKIVMKIDRGDIYRIGRIEIFGNTKTKDKVIRREMSLNEGDIFNSRLLRRSYEKINNLNFFETVELTPKPDTEKKTIDIDIKVKEKPTGFLSIGGGYSTVDKFVGMIDITQANLFGTGRYIKLKGEFGGRSTFYEFSYRDPWFLDKPVSFTLSAYNTRRDYLAYSKKATGGSIGFGKRFTEYWKVSLTYTYERVTIFDVSEDASIIIKEQIGTNTTSSITPAITRDSRDYFLDPSRGSRNSLYVTFAGLGGNNKFIKGVFDSAWFFPVTERTVFSIRGRIGYADGLFGEKLPLYERFYVGGLYTVRGLGFGEAGPRDENGEVIGGKKELIFNLEYKFPLVEELKLKGVIFFDAGRAYDDSEEFGSDLRYTTGAGIRWLSPLGPIRIDYGFNIDRREGESSGKAEFAFGAFF